MARKKRKYPEHLQHRMDTYLDKIQNIITDCGERGADTYELQSSWSNLLGAHHSLQSKDLDDL
tara:strand:- start:245 stop:433 length:189 start_codon:yes stop_codon:yes gene_type:complete